MCRHCNTALGSTQGLPELRHIHTTIVVLITEMATEWLVSRKLYTIWTAQRDDSHPGQDRAGWWRFHHVTQKGKQFKTYKLFISGTFHLIFLEHSWPQVTEITKVKMWLKEDYRIVLLGYNNVQCELSGVYLECRVPNLCNYRKFVGILT
jgi:hypothetical protein